MDPAEDRPQPPFRVGVGYDRHRLEPVGTNAGRPLIVGGVRLEHDRGPVGHSDGDALLHAVTDALLGALALPDIGELFPDDDPRHEGRDSSEFVEEAVRRVHDLGWRVANLDCVVVLERPRLKPVKDRVRQNLARLLLVEREGVNVKGKTGEGVDAVGEGRSIEAHAVVLLARAAVETA